MFSKILQNYLKFWSKKYLNRAKPKIIAITGSVGKTTTKEAVFTVLAEKFQDKICKAEGNLNTETGVPLAILGYKKSPKKFYEWLPIILSVPFKSLNQKKFEIMVLEFAADKPGDIKYLTSFVRPNIAIITAVGPSHLEAFGTIDKIIEEKISILWPLTSDGLAILNIDDESLRKASYGGRFSKTTYAIDRPADFMAQDIRIDISQMKAQTKFKVKGKMDFEVCLPVPSGKAGVYAALAAVSVANYFELSQLEIKNGLEKMINEKHRMQIFEGLNSSVIIDDCYNANPMSMKNALNVLNSLKAKRKIAVLGDMREIGQITNEAHEEIGRLALKTTDLVIAIGESARKYNASKFFKSKEKAIDYLLKEVRNGDILLVKASRSLEFDQIVEALIKK